MVTWGFPVIRASVAAGSSVVTGRLVHVGPLTAEELSFTGIFVSARPVDTGKVVFGVALTSDGGSLSATGEVVPLVLSASSGGVVDGTEIVIEGGLAAFEELVAARDSPSALEFSDGEGTMCAPGFMAGCLGRGGGGLFLIRRRLTLTRGRSLLSSMGVLIIGKPVSAESSIAAE